MHHHSICKKRKTDAGLDEGSFRNAGSKILAMGRKYSNYNLAR
jgi:hypothetical protein